MIINSPMEITPSDTMVYCWNNTNILVVNTTEAHDWDYIGSFFRGMLWYLNLYKKMLENNNAI